MEKAPNSFEGGVIDEEIEKSSDDPESRFKKQLEKGLEFYCEISGEKKEDADIHPEQQLLFSYLDKNDTRKAKKESKLPILSEYGLQIGDTIYGFNDDYKEQILRFRAERLTKRSDDIEDFFDNLDAETQDFKDEYIKNIQKSFVEEARKPFIAQKEEVENEVNSKYLQKTVNTFGCDYIKEIYSEQNYSSKEASAIFSGISDRIQALQSIDHKEQQDYPEKLDYTLPKNASDKEKAAYNKELKKKQAEFDEGIKLEKETAQREFETFKQTYKLADLDDEKALEIINEAKKRHKEAKKQFILDGFMTKDEYDELMSYRNGKNFIKIEDEENGLWKRLKSGEKRQIFAAYRTLQESVKVEEGEKYAEKMGDDFDYKACKRVFYSAKQSQYNSYQNSKKYNEEMGLYELYPFLRPDKDSKQKEPSKVPTVEESIKNLKEVLKVKIGEEDPFNNIDEVITLTRRKLELEEKYCRGEVKFGPTPYHANVYISEQKSIINEEMHKKTEAITYQCAVESLENIGGKITGQIFGDKDVKKVYFTPAGCFVEFLDGHCGVHAISPFDSRIDGALGEDEKKAWGKTWANLHNSYQSKGTPPSGLVDYVNQQFREATQEFSTSITNGSYEQLNALREKLGFDINELFDSKATMNHLPTANEIKILSEVIPGISEFITSINFNAIREDGHHKINLEGLTKNLKAALCGFGSSSHSADVRDLVTIDDKGATLNFFPYQTILYDLNGDHEKARSLFYSCLGYELMIHQDDKKIKEFANLLGEKINVSRQSIYRNYGIMLISPLDRREIATKTYFVSEFNKFAHGVAEKKYEDYFNSLINRTEKSS